GLGMPNHYRVDAQSCRAKPSRQTRCQKIFSSTQPWFSGTGELAMRPPYGWVENNCFHQEHSLETPALLGRVGIARCKQQMVSVAR
ncbi:hypothetical protein KI387_031657, partial [Taxus chinensis]